MGGRGSMLSFEGLEKTSLSINKSEITKGD